jgi:hypothetical protein
MALFRTFVIVVLAFSLLAAACSDDASSEDSDSPTGVVFGDGEVPETVPEGYPIPEGARIGSTLIDYDNGVTEMLMIIPAPVPAVAAFYEVNLESAGYTIESSEGTEAAWDIVFRVGDVDGELTLRAGGAEITEAAVRFTES